MSASTMEQQGKKTTAKVLAKVGKKPKSATLIASQVVIKQRGTKKTGPLSPAMARIILKELAHLGTIVSEKQGRENVYRLPTVADVPKERLTGILAPVATLPAHMRGARDTEVVG